MKYVLLCFVLLLVCVPGARGDLVSARNYQTNWVEPALRSVFTSSQGPVSARLLVDAHTFDTGNAKTKGKLQICRKGRVSFAETFVSNKGKADIVRISGPRLIAGKGSDEPAVLLEVQCYQKVDAYEYDFDKKAGQYQKQKPSINPVDARNQGTKMEGVRKVTCGNTGAVLHWQQELCDFGGTDWMLNIKKGYLVTSRHM